MGAGFSGRACGVDPGPRAGSAQGKTRGPVMTAGTICGCGSVDVKLGPHHGQQQDGNGAGERKHIQHGPDLVGWRAETHPPTAPEWPGSQNQQQVPDHRLAPSDGAPLPPLKQPCFYTVFTCPAADGRAVLRLVHEARAAFHGVFAGKSASLFTLFPARPEDIPPQWWWRFRQSRFRRVRGSLRVGRGIVPLPPPDHPR